MEILGIIQSLCVMGLLIYASFCDLRRREVPNCATVLIGVCAMICPDPMKLWGLLLALLFFGIAFFAGGIGGGDVKLVAALSLVLGFEKGAVMLIVASVAELVFYSISYIRCKVSGREKPSRLLPLVPFFTLGYLVAILI